jgi:uncharacterized protein YeaO (DUF488 family)/DNA-binding MarR family transcriptional regulator
VTGVSLSDAVYGRLLALRTGLRHFERWSEQQARANGLTPAQHQLLLAIRGHSDPRGPTIGEVADYLLLRHHSVVGLIDRADAAELVRRTRDESDHRVVRLTLTTTGAERLEALSALHLEEIERLSPNLPVAWAGLGPVQRPHGFAGLPRSTLVSIDRVYDVIGNDPSRGVLVDRLWPRGLSKSEAPFDSWPKDLAPSPQLRVWYGHDPARFEEFDRRYRAELKTQPAAEALTALIRRSRESDMILLTATKDLAHSGAAVLQAVISET